MSNLISALEFHKVHIPASELKTYSIVKTWEENTSPSKKRAYLKAEYSVLKSDVCIGTFKTKNDAKEFIMASERRNIRQRIKRMAVTR